MPDVIGMSPEEATAALEADELAAAPVGEGTEVATQFPAAGTSVEPGTEVTLNLESPLPEGTRDDPFPFGTTLSGSESGVEVATVLVGTAVWGADAQVMAENQFNDPAPEGHTYVLLPVTVTNVASAEPIAAWLDIEIAYVAPDGRSYEREFQTIPNSLTDVADLYEGGSATGNVPFILPVTAQGGVWAVSYGWSDPVFVTAG